MLLRAAELRFGYGRPQASGHKQPAARSQTVIDNLSLAIDRGALVGVLGPNGSGKTTLLRLLAGTLKPHAGRVMLDGEDIARMSRAVLARRFAVVPQETQLAFEYTVLEIALMGRYPHLGAFEIEGPDDFESALAALDTTGTRHLADRPFRTLSGGEKQRVIVASALAQLDQLASHHLSPALGAPPPSARAAALADSLSSPGSPITSRVLFLDEPTASLDLRYQVQMVELLRRLHDRQDVSIVLSTHDVHFARVVCNDLVLLREGRILARGAPSDVLTVDRIVALYDVDPSSPLMDVV